MIPDKPAVFSQKKYFYFSILIPYASKMLLKRKQFSEEESNLNDETFYDTNGTD